MGRELFVFGGVTPDPTNEIANLNDAWAFDAAFDAAKNKWRGLRPFPIAVRGASAVKLDKHRILIAGGYGGQPEGFTAAAFLYDTKRDVYIKTKAAFGNARREPLLAKPDAGCTMPAITHGNGLH